MNRALLWVLVVISRLRSLALPESKLPSLFWQIYANLSLDFGAISSVVERLLHTQEVAGSNPASRTRSPTVNVLRFITGNWRLSVITPSHNISPTFLFNADTV